MPKSFCVANTAKIMLYTVVPGYSQILSRSHGKNWEKAWDHYYVNGPEMVDS